MQNGGLPRHLLEVLAPPHTSIEGYGIAHRPRLVGSAVPSEFGEICQASLLTRQLFHLLHMQRGVNLLKGGDAGKARVVDEGHVGSCRRQKIIYLLLRHKFVVDVANLAAFLQLPQVDEPPHRIGGGHRNHRQRLQSEVDAALLIQLPLAELSRTRLLTRRFVAQFAHRGLVRQRQGPLLLHHAVGGGRGNVELRLQRGVFAAVVVRAGRRINLIRHYFLLLHGVFPRALIGVRHGEIGHACGCRCGSEGLRVCPKLRRGGQGHRLAPRRLRRLGALRAHCRVGSLRRPRIFFPIFVSGCGMTCRFDACPILRAAESLCQAPVEVVLKGKSDVSLLLARDTLEVRNGLPQAAPPAPPLFDVRKVVAIVPATRVRRPVRPIKDREERRSGRLRIIFKRSELRRLWLGEA
mmetsp:Transcript_33529/g.56302  ORF Transcript_33529/g.56302 Transcript_33529/m.56302 type:complete len:408 (-) Transcript_33529:610-1833(-)